MYSCCVLKPGGSREIARAKAFALLLILPLAFAIHLAPGFFKGLLIYDRTAIVHGEVWRLWTGHLVHFSNSHLLLDTSVCAILLFSLSIFAKRDRVWFLVFFPPLLSLGLLATRPNLLVYGGLSGWGAGLFVLFCLAQGQNHSRFRFVYWLLFVGFIAKTICEFAVQEPLLATFSDEAIRNEPAGHLIGAVLSTFWTVFARFLGATTIEKINLNRELTTPALLI